MNFTLSDDQQEITRLAERIFAERAAAERVAAVEATTDRVDHELWATLADAGLLGMAIPEEHGGAGLGLVELCLVLEQQGRRVAPVPLLATLVLGALPIAEFGTAEQRGAWLPGVSAGSVFLTAALDDAGSRDPFRPATTAQKDGQGWRLDGLRLAVPAAHVAARIVVPAGTDDGGVALFLVDPAAEGVALESAETSNRAIAPHLHLTGARVGAGDVLAGPDTGTDALRWLLDRAHTGLAAIAVGVAEEAVRMTAAYTSERQQFGRPLATFQGVALRAADAYIDTEAMRVTMWQAAWRLAEGLDAERAVATATWWAADGGHRVVHAAQHLHGGLGADVDYPVHRYFLWGKQIGTTYGSASEQLAGLGARIARDAKTAAAAR